MTDIGLEATGDPAVIRRRAGSSNQVSARGMNVAGTSCPRRSDLDGRATYRTMPSRGVSGHRGRRALCSLAGHSPIPASSMGTRSVRRWMVIPAMMALLSGCCLLMPPPNDVPTSIVLQDGNGPRFLYRSYIASERELRRKHYYLGGVQVREADCPGARCDRLVWETASDAVWSRPQPSADLVVLPESLRYGDVIPGMTTLVPAEVLQANVIYSVVIGIMGLDDNAKNEIHFAAQALFSLREDSNGQLHVREERPSAR
jgi:hypothetical protein